MSPATTACESCKAELQFPVKIRPGLAYYCCEVCGHCIKFSACGFDLDFATAQAHYFAEDTLLATQEPATFDREILKQRQAFALRMIPSASRIIEVGPGAGFFATYLKSMGHSLQLIEHSVVLAAILAKRLDVNVVVGEFLPGLYKGPAADAFCSFHVIEHVQDPLAHMRAGLEAVRPGGIGFVATPNAASWQQRLFPKLSPNFDSAHLRVFTEISLKRICETSGWTVEAAYTPEYTSGWLRVISKALRKLKSEDEEKTAGKYSASSVYLDLVYALVSRLSWPFRITQSYLHGGNEVFLVLRRQDKYEK